MATRVPTSRSHSDASASSTIRRCVATSPARAASIGSDSCSATNVRELEAAVIAFHQPLDARFGSRQLFGGGAEALHGLLEELQGAGELQLLTLELMDDGFESLQPLLEGQRVRDW